MDVVVYNGIPSAQSSLRRSVHLSDHHEDMVVAPPEVEMMDAHG